MTHGKEYFCPWHKLQARKEAMASCFCGVHYEPTCMLKYRWLIKKSDYMIKPTYLVLLGAMDGEIRPLVSYGPAEFEK